MKNNHKVIVLFICFSFVINSLAAQWALPDATAESTELTQIKTAYSQAGQVSCKMMYRLYAPSTTRAADSLSGSLTMFGNDYHFKVAHFEYIKEGSLLLYVDHQAHELVLLNTGQNGGNPVDAGILASMLDKEGVATTLQNLGGKQRKLSLDMPQSGIENVEVWYTTDTYFVGHTRLKLSANQAIVDVQYSQYNQQKVKKMPSIKQFAVLKNKKYTASAAFKQYKLSVRG